MTPVIEFQHVTKRFGALTVLDNISFQVNAQDIVGILGVSGAGKTTILKLIAGLERPDEGVLHNRAERIGYVFQEPRLLPWRTALDNVVLAMVAQGWRRDEARERAIRYFRRVGLEAFVSYYPAQLSGGMKQRVSLLRAFAIQPDLLLLDEPFTGLDIKTKSVLEEMLRELWESRPIPVLYVSHFPSDLLKFANRIFVLTDGKLTEMPEEHIRNVKSALEGADKPAASLMEHALTIKSAVHSSALIL